MIRLVAKAVAAELRDGEASLFSTEAGASPASFTQDELFALSPAYSELYAQLISALVPALEVEGLPREAAAVALRDAVPSAAHLVLDRAMRLARFAAARGKGFEVSGAGAPAGPFARPEKLRSAASSSRELNEAVLARLAPALGLAVVPAVPSPAAPEPAVEKGYVNYNFEGRSAWRKARGRFYRAVAHWWPGRAPALGLSYATYILQDAGLFGLGRLEFLRGRIAFPEAVPAPDRRAALAAALVTQVPAFEDMLRRGGAGEAARALAASCAALMAELFPASAWEGAAACYEAARAALERFPRTALVLSETGNVEATYLLAAARARGMETIGVQEGGHYGYEDDYVAGYEMEYPHFDRYVTWGWTRFPEGKGMGRVKAVPLPTPWLSERRRQWRRDLGDLRAWWARERPFDLLFMSNKIYPYPPAPSGAAVSRSDHTPGFAAQLLDLAREARARGLRVLHKSLNVDTMRELAGTMAAMREIAGDGYAHVERMDKGLHPGLVSRARVIVWDQPGTGFLECLTAGLPTLVLWDRLYNREVPWSRALFERLEAAGLVHRRAASLLAEIGRFKTDPVGWMQGPERVGARDAFCAEYARTDDSWEKPWEALLREACSRR